MILILAIFALPILGPIGIGIACVIKNFVEKELRNGTLIEIPMPFEIPKRNIGFVYRKKQFKNPALESFLDFYKNYSV